MIDFSEESVDAFIDLRTDMDSRVDEVVLQWGETSDQFNSYYETITNWYMYKTGAVGIDIEDDDRYTRSIYLPIEWFQMGRDDRQKAMNEKWSEMETKRRNDQKQRDFNNLLHKANLMGLTLVDMKGKD